MEKISWTDRVKNEVLQRVNGEKNFLLTIKRRKAKWIGSLKNKRPTCCHLLFYFTSYVLNMFRTLIYPS